MVSRRAGRRLASAVEAALWENYLTAEHVHRTQAKAERHEAIKAAREEGTYWAEQESRRAAQLPTHVEVDPDAGRLIRQRAVAQGVTVGELVGHLVTQAAYRRVLGQYQSESGRRRGPPGEDRQARRFARLAVAPDTWLVFRSAAIGANRTVAPRSAS